MRHWLANIGQFRNVISHNYLKSVSNLGHAVVVTILCLLYLMFALSMAQSHILYYVQVKRCQIWSHTLVYVNRSIFLYCTSSDSTEVHSYTLTLDVVMIISYVWTLYVFHIVNLFCWYTISNIIYSGWSWSYFARNVHFYS